MMLTFDLETSFIVIAHPLPKSILWVKFEPDWNKGKEDKLQTTDLGWKDWCTDRLITIKIKFKRDPALLQFLSTSAERIFATLNLTLNCTIQFLHIFLQWQNDKVKNFGNNKLHVSSIYSVACTYQTMFYPKTHCILF